MDWISVNERLPGHDDIVLAYRPNETLLRSKYTAMFGWQVKINYTRIKTIQSWAPLNHPGRDTAGGNTWH